MIEIEDLRQFVALDEYHTLSAAAEQLHISQPSLSRTMQKMERELQVSLFERQKNKIVLNDNGRLATQQARLVLEMLDSMVSNVRAFDRANRTLSIGSCAPVPMYEMAAHCATLWPEMSVSTEIRELDQLLPGLLSRLYQVIILPKEASEADCVSQLIGKEQLYVRLPEKHPLAGRPSVSGAELDGSHFLVFSRIGFWHSLHHQLIPHAQFHLQDQWDSFNTLINASSLLSFTTDVILRNEDVPAHYVAVPFSDPAAYVHYYAVYRKQDQKRLAPLAKAMANTISSFGSYHRSI